MIVHLVLEEAFPPQEGWCRVTFRDYHKRQIKMFTPASRITSGPPPTMEVEVLQAGKTEGGSAWVSIGCWPSGGQRNFVVRRAQILGAIPKDMGMVHPKGRVAASAKIHGGVGHG